MLRKRRVRPPVSPRDYCEGEEGTAACLAQDNHVSFRGHRDIMADGYARVLGRPQAVIVHFVVGDGSFMCAAPSSALWVGRKYEILVLTIVLSNEGQEERSIARRERTVHQGKPFRTLRPGPYRSGARIATIEQTTTTGRGFVASGGCVLRWNRNTTAVIRSVREKRTTVFWWLDAQFRQQRSTTWLVYLTGILFPADGKHRGTQPCWYTYPNGLSAAASDDEINISFWPTPNYAALAEAAASSGADGGDMTETGEGEWMKGVRARTVGEFKAAIQLAKSRVIQQRKGMLLEVLM
ncbi:uncharacterized protein F4807DRAFT_461167 [Annulohypoxylon truncatum]|uniref:uncharacterized protein n=1 Tax=Annulohypoxylon truncatum TaxID=327061 RepID=UPI002007D355|nr:uncharacterized protein F4807DRAFT_461167 [Annulohypoxylon truncatum]KAI1209048.1 hypothetical protein F4807DRAFT_461167 [Annulohypoxylon truncatum]